MTGGDDRDVGHVSDGYIQVLGRGDSGGIARVGGKGANLHRLMRAGLPVPEAWCVTTEGYRHFVESNALRAPILDGIDGIDYDDLPRLVRRAATIRDMLAAAALPEDLDAAIRAQHADCESRLGPDLFVAVRSSATAEDLPGASFAGQQDTYLDVQGADDVVDHIRRCWASLWTDRAISYRHRQGFSHADVLLAVVVQQMYPSEVAGVMFTADPVTANPDRIVVNASWGLGEAIVSGAVAPDEYELDKHSGELTDRRIGAKSVMTVRRAGGSGTEAVPVPEDRRGIPVLDPEELRELGAIGRRIEDVFGAPQDVEWGRAGGRFAVLQARDITGTDLDFGEELEAWQTPAARRELTDQRWVWSRAYSDELQTGPSTPLMYTFAQPHRIRTRLLALEYAGVDDFAGYSSDTYQDMPLFRWYGSRAYYNLAFEREWIRTFIPPFARDAVALAAFPEDQRAEIRDLPFDWWKWTSMLVRLEVRHPTRSLLGSTHYLLEHFEEWIEHADDIWRDYDIESATSIGELFMTLLRGREGNELDENVALPFNFYLYVLPHGLRWMCERWCADTDGSILGALLAGQRTPTGEQNQAVWELSRHIVTSPTLMALFENPDDREVLATLDSTGEGLRFKAIFDQFLAGYGHRGARERDPYHHRWGQRPELVLPALRALLPLGPEDAPARREARLHEAMVHTKQECLRAIRRQPLGALKAAAFKWYLELVQEYSYYRDWERFQNDRDGLHFRPLLEKAGRLLVAKGCLGDPEDVFFLGLQELIAADAGTLQAPQIAVRVRARRAVYDRYTHREPPKYLRGWEKWDDAPHPAGSNTLRGTAASTGTVTGRARVCRSLDQIHTVEKGDILVTVATDPAWTTVYSIIGGVVIETGGVVSHAVMISREYGLPCVANLARACELIADGATITVDGGRGTVTIGG